MQEQRTVGNILVRHGVVTGDALESLYAQQREKGGELVDLVVQTQAASDVCTGASSTAAKIFWLRTICRTESPNSDSVVG